MVKYKQCFELETHISNSLYSTHLNYFVKNKLNRLKKKISDYSLLGIIFKHVCLFI